ncbi:MAG: type IV secretion system DNA-binding domain-containing protein [Candidatus Terrybacteria bacterium]|nr:type IV secretion system DNA-binding domain-containing protein [Candidatus Terrybacteria bacterium]
MLWIVTLVLFVAAVLAGGFFWDRLRDRFELRRSLDSVLFRVALPRVFPQEEEQRKKPEKEQIAVMEQFYAAFSRLSDRGMRALLLGPPHIALELALPSVGEEIAFYVAAPRFFADETEKAIHGIYEAAHVERIRDYNIFHPYGVAAGASVTLRRHFALPIRTYQTLETDPLRTLTTALSKLAVEGEGAAIQLLVRPAPQGRRFAGLRIARQMQKSGHSFERARREVSGAWQFFGAMRPEMRSRDRQRMMPSHDPNRPWYAEQQQPLTPLVQEVVRGVEAKASKLLFEVNIRVLAAAPVPAQAEEILNHLKVAFHQFDAPELNGPKIVTHRSRALKRLAYQYAFRIFDPGRAITLSTEELTTLYHLPNVSLETPKVRFLKARPASPPPNLPKEGILLGQNTYRGIVNEARISPDDRRRHLYVVGQTGTGKTTLLRELIRQDIVAGRGVAVIDPHGDLAESVLTLVPEERAEDVIYFDPADMERPMGLNMLEWRTEEQKDFAVQEMVRIFEKLFPPEIIGPMFEHNMRNAMLTLMADPDDPGTIVEIPRIFTDETFARRYIARVTDPLVRAFWEQEMAKTTEFHKSEMLGYLISKVGRFVENAMMRNIIGQAHSSFDLRRVMDEGRIFVANLSKGRVGEVNASLLGLILVGKMQMAALARADVLEADRRDFHLYIDEFQNFTTESIATILSEARKYRLNLTIAHQFIAQLADPIREAVFGNVGSLVSFRVGPKDAEFLAKQFAPVFTEQDLVNIENFHAYVKLMIRGVAERPFNIEISPPAQGRSERFAALRDLSRMRFGRARTEVEQEILDRSQLGAAGFSEQGFTPGERNA